MTIPQTRKLLQNRMMWLAAIMVVAIVLVLLLVLRPSPSENDPSTVTLIAPRDGATVVLLHRFIWHKTYPPAVFHFFLYEVNRTTVWSTLVKDSSLVLPSSVPLQRGKTYLWRVDAILADEKTIHSELRAFTLSQ